jgi:hypothetical protein
MVRHWRLLRPRSLHSAAHPGTQFIRPGYRTANLAVIKLTALSERVNIEVRGEVFDPDQHSSARKPERSCRKPDFRVDNLCCW